MAAVYKLCAGMWPEIKAMSLFGSSGYILFQLKDLVAT